MPQEENPNVIGFNTNSETQPMHYPSNELFGIQEGKHWFFTKDDIKKHKDTTVFFTWGNSTHFEDRRTGGGGMAGTTAGNQNIGVIASVVRADEGGSWEDVQAYHNHMKDIAIEFVQNGGTVVLATKDDEGTSTVGGYLADVGNNIIREHISDVQKFTKNMYNELKNTQINDGSNPKDAMKTFHANMDALETAYIDKKLSEFKLIGQQKKTEKMVPVAVPSTTVVKTKAIPVEQLVETPKTSSFNDPSVDIANRNIKIPEKVRSSSDKKVLYFKKNSGKRKKEILNAYRKFPNYSREFRRLCAINKRKGRYSRRKTINPISKRYNKRSGYLAK